MLLSAAVDKIAAKALDVVYSRQICMGIVVFVFEWYGYIVGGLICSAVQTMSDA